MDKEIDNIGISLYDMNKSLIAQTEKKVKGKKLTELLNKVAFPYFEKRSHSGSYYMLLCNELKDYTVFNLSNNKSIGKLVSELKVCMQNRGDVYTIRETEDNVALEIWIKPISDEELHCYYLFPYDEGVIVI